MTEKQWKKIWLKCRKEKNSAKLIAREKEMSWLSNTKVIKRI